jgi:TolC family type I secretion outer membrane protein
MTRISRLSFCALAALSCWAGTGVAQAETLRDALAMAYAGNPQLESERAKLRATDEGVPEALSGWRPTLSAQGNAGFSHLEFDTTSGNLHPRDAGVSLSQPVWRGGQTVAATRQANESVLQERAVLADTEQSVLVDTATSYLDVLRDQEILKLNDEYQKTLESYLEEAKERAQLGEKTQTDVSQAQSRLLQAQADRNTASTSLKASLSAYQRFTGHIPGALDKPEFKPVIPGSRQAAIEDAQEQAPAVQAAEHAARAQNAAVRQADGVLLPEVSLQGSANRAWNENVPEQNVNDNHTENDQVVMRVNVPLYTGGADYAKLREARQRMRASERDLDEARAEAGEKAEQAWDELQTAAQNVELHRQQAQAAQAALEGMESEERAGDRTSTDRLNAQQEVLNANIASAQAAHDQTVASFRLMAAVGGFTADKLDLKVDLYDPQAHYRKSKYLWFGIRD